MYEIKEDRSLFSVVILFYFVQEAEFEICVCCICMWTIINSLNRLSRISILFSYFSILSFILVIFVCVKLLINRWISPTTRWLERKIQNDVCLLHLLFRYNCSINYLEFRIKNLSVCYNESRRQSLRLSAACYGFVTWNYSNWKQYCICQPSNKLQMINLSGDFEWDLN